MMLTSNGYLGIGTLNPTNTLDLVGNIKGSCNLMIGNSCSISNNLVLGSNCTVGNNCTINNS